MKKLLPLLGCLLFVCPAALARKEAYRAPEARVNAEKMPQFAQTETLVEKLSLQLKRHNWQALEKVKLEGCRPFWNKYPQQMMNIPKLADEACEAFKSAGRSCDELGDYVYRSLEYQVAGRNANILLAGYRQGFVTDQDEIDFILKIQNNLTLGTAPAVITFLPKKYWIHSLTVPQAYDFCVNAAVSSEKYYNFSCDRSLPVLEEVLRDIIRRGGPLY